MAIKGGPFFPPSTALFCLHRPGRTGSLYEPAAQKADFPEERIPDKKADHREANTYSKGGPGREYLQIRRSPWEKNDRPKRERSEKSRLKAPLGKRIPDKNGSSGKENTCPKADPGEKSVLAFKRADFGKACSKPEEQPPECSTKGLPPDFRASFPPSCALREIFSQCPLKTIAFFLRIYYNSKASNEAAAFCLGVAQFGSAHEWGS